MLNAQQALETLSPQGIDFKADFFTLPPSAIELLLEEADRQKYRKPKNANGSRGRYFYTAIQRKL